MIRTGTFKYVGWLSLPEHFQTGWMVVAELGPVHGVYSCLCWHCECGDWEAV